MRPNRASKSGYKYYRCRARDIGQECEQKGVRVDTIDEQVVSILMILKPPKEWRKGIMEARSEILGDNNLDERIAEIKGIIKRMDARWDHGFVTNEEEYFQQRIELQTPQNCPDHCPGGLGKMSSRGLAQLGRQRSATRSPKIIVEDPTQQLMPFNNSRPRWFWIRDW